jgi:hypothetical protein
MKKRIFFSVLGVMLLLIPGALGAFNQPGVSQDTPAILASLGQANAIPLDDLAAAAVRGQAQYVLVRVIGLNTFDGGSGVQWTLNPLGYRYGNWGGPGWSDGQNNPQVVDPSGVVVDGNFGMDACFRTHDLVYYSNPTAQQKSDADNALLVALNSLPKTAFQSYKSSTYHYNWGDIYVTTPIDAPPSVSVFGLSLIGQRIFLGWNPMPYSEYSRREAVYGMQLMILGKSILRLN